MPLINLYVTLYGLLLYAMIVFVLSIYGAIIEKRLDLVLAFPCYMFLKYVNAFVFLEQFIKEVKKKKKKLTWYKPKRVEIKKVA